MEILLLIIAGIVVYFLYNTLQDFLKNPINQERFDSIRSGRMPSFSNTEPIPATPYTQSLQDSIIHNEYAVLAAILGRVVWSDDKKCELEMCLLDELLESMAQEAKKSFITKSVLEDIIDEQKSPKVALEELCEEYVSLTKGEYKKRLKVVEFLFALAYADGELSQGEQDCILDIAAYFEIANEDFNTLLTQFEQEYQKDISISEAKAREIFGLDEKDSISKESLNEKYENLIKQAQQNIFDNKNINKSFYDNSLLKIREIDSAYQLLAKDALESTQTDSTQNTESTDKDSQADKKRGWDF